MNKINVILAATLAACSVAFADTTDPTVKVQTFENETNTNYIWEPGEGSGWTTTPAVATSEAEASDYPAIETVGSPTVAPDNGYGVVDAAHTKVLSLNGGSATVTMSDASSSPITSDLLVKVVYNSGDLSVEGFDNAKLAIAVATDGKFYACTNGASFFRLSETVYSEDTWVRVTTLIDYPNKRCRIALNGELACNGAWLSLPGTTAEDAPSLLTVKSSSCIDDVVVKAEKSGYVYDKYAAVTTERDEALTGDNPKVPTNYATKYGVAAVDVDSDVRAAYEKGVAPDGTFAITEGSFDGTKVTLKFPGDWPADAYVVKYGNSPDKLTSTATMSSSTMSGGNNTVVVDGNMSGGTVLYYQVTRTL